MSVYSPTGLNSALSTLSGMPPINYNDPNYNLFNVTTAPLSTAQQGAVGVAEAATPGQFSLFNPSVGSIMDILQGKFPDFSASISPEVNMLTSAGFEAAQPELEQGVAQIESAATGAGQTGVSTPAAGEIGSLYQNVLNSVLSNAVGAGANQYGQNLGLKSALAQLGLQQPSASIANLTSTGGLEQNTAQAALTSLYQQFLQQTGLSENDINAILSYVLGGVAVPNEPPTQYGPSPFQELVGAAGTLLPFFVPKPV